MINIIYRNKFSSNIRKYVANLQMSCLISYNKYIYLGFAINIYKVSIARHFESKIK